MPQTCLNGLQAESASSADTTGTTSYTLESTPLELLSLDDVLTQAWASGYANRFDALAIGPDTPPWRPVLADGTGLYHCPRPTAQGSLSATVVGPNGEVTPRPDQELFTDRLGRIRIKLHFQGQPENLQGDPHGDANASCWVRVVQRSAGGGMGHQFIPRIGQEVLVQFLEGDIDRPIVLAALYNGQGEGGVLPTPGGLQPGNEEANDKAQVFAQATDHRSSAQGNRIGSGTGGHSPVWHGAAASAGADGHNNASAQWGIRSKEHGGQGYNQLVMDDSDGAGPQGRIQLKTTQAATELNLGHLLHTADNYRGSFRGTGAELRTDAYGALRAGQGWLISSYRLQHGPAQRDPAGDNSAGMALQKQLETLAGAFSQAAATHRTVALAGHIGTTQANTSAIDDQAAVFKAQRIAASGMVDGHSLQAALGDAAAKSTQVDTDKVPHSSAATIAIAAKAGLGVVAGQHLQWANGETASAMSGQDSQYVTGGQLRVHTGQAIGILAGVVQAGPNTQAAGLGGLGLQLVAAQDAIDLQAQADTLKVQAKDLVNVVSANAHIDWAAAQSIEIATAGGANVTISSAGVKHTAPGMILVKAGEKVFVGPGSVNYALPVMPRSICVECLKKSLAAAPAFTTVG